MSYEGFVQCVCSRGHYFECDEVYWEDSPQTCSEVFNGEHCGAEIIFENSVDDTNCEAHGFIEHKHFANIMIKDKTVNTCQTCKHKTTVNDATYDVGKVESLRTFRTYYDTEKNESVLIGTEEPDDNF